MSPRQSLGWREPDLQTALADRSAARRAVRAGRGSPSSPPVEVVNHGRARSAAPEP